MYSTENMAFDLQAVITYFIQEKGVEFFIHRTNLRLLKLAIECGEPPSDYEAAIQSLKTVLNHISNQGLPVNLEDAFLNLARYCAGMAERVTCP